MIVNNSKNEKAKKKRKKNENNWIKIFVTNIASRSCKLRVIFRFALTNFTFFLFSQTKKNWFGHHFRLSHNLLDFTIVTKFCAVFYFFSFLCFFRLFVLVFHNGKWNTVEVSRRYLFCIKLFMIAKYSSSLNRMKWTKTHLSQNVISFLFYFFFFK